LLLFPWEKPWEANAMTAALATKPRVKLRRRFMECIRERLENAIEGKSDEKDATWLKGHLDRQEVRSTTALDLPQG
jgi:hypothetical protein